MARGMLDFQFQQTGPCELTISKTMSDAITLLCLVHGESYQHAFPVDITKNKLVRHMKEQIHKKLHPQFELFPFNDLTLWRVSIPAEDDALL